MALPLESWPSPNILIHKCLFEQYNPFCIAVGNLMGGYVFDKNTCRLTMQLWQSAPFPSASKEITNENEAHLAQVNVM